MTIHALRFVSLVAAVFAAATLTVPAEAQQKVSLVFSAGPTGGTWTPMAAATAEVIKKKYPELDVLVEPGAAIALAAGLEGYFIRSATWLERGIFVVAALLLIDPSFVTDLVGVALLGTALMMQRLRPAAVSADPRYL
jgi:hypothetical protein